IVAAIGMTALRAKRMSGTEARSSLSVSIATAPAYVNDVAVTFRKLRGFLESLPRDRTLLIGGRGTVGRWSAISDIDYYYPDSALAATVAKRDVYLVHECGTRDYCLVDSKWLSIAQAPVDEYGKFSYELVFNHETKHARAAVYRMRLVN
ncbi:MAG TPA: hypothetical protein VM939_13545, partial [Gemmatimonadaceae bacterium]|nr:hypothetical protein [Gemmatimonadaceae bacterium]